MLQNVLTRFPTVAEKILGAMSPSSAEIHTLLQIAYLTAEIDLDTDSDESTLLRSVNGALWKLAGQHAEVVPVVSPLPLPGDSEARVARIRELASTLASTQIRELAYAIGYLFTVADLAMQPVEGAYLEDLARELSIDPQRASELVATVAETVTPAER